MTIAPPFLESMTEDDAAWQTRLAQGGCFVIAEASMNDAVPWLAERWGGSLEQTSLYWGEAGRIHASVSPYCIPLNVANWPQVKEHVVTQPGWGMGLQLAWFMLAYSPLDQLIEVTKHLRQWSLVTSPSGENAILRVGDWQVVNQLLSASSAQEACAFYGPIAHFCDISPEGAIRALNLTTREPHAIPDSLPRQLSTEQWHAIMTPSEHQHLARYMEHLRTYHANWQDASDDELQAFICQQAEQAKSNGFNNDRDIVRWLALATELSPTFLHQPWAKDILGQSEFIGTQSRMDRLYQAAIDHLDDA
ncbi:DUF4123 domain-containing protein [Pectobacterium cacticida]|uniref:DUF4123 domain-containing protein n=1 Tax=Pectobacterium cacticida TaxID=69221 RepID=UPI002FF05DE1